MKSLKIMALILLCTGCTQLTETGDKANNAVRRSVYESADKIQELVQYNPPPTTPLPPQVGYCYNTMTDIVCYEIPQPHLSNKLVGFQGPAVMPEQLPLPTAANTLTTDQVLMEGAGRATPFYIKEAPYIKADGEVVTSTRIMPLNPAAPVTPVAPAQLPPPTDQTGGPKRLMPRY